LPRYTGLKRALDLRVIEGGYKRRYTGPSFAQQNKVWQLRCLGLEFSKSYAKLGCARGPASRGLEQEGA
jgi:hypothetical protein